VTSATVLRGDCLEVLARLPAESVQTCVTSPPYWGLRDYGHAGQLGLEKTPDEYVAKLVQVFREVRRVLKPDGTLWLNLGDSYATKPNNNAYHHGGYDGSGLPNWDRQVKVRKASKYDEIPPGLKPKDLVGIPWRVAFALQADGWWLRSDIIWAKPNPMPESVTDRPTKAHEYLFLLAKAERYFYDAEAVAERAVYLVSPDRKRSGDYQVEAGRNDGPEHRSGGFVTGERRNRRTVWTVTPEPFEEAHFAVMPPELVRPCVKAGSKKGDTVLDPFTGSGTTGVVALQEGRHFVGVELNPAYVEMAERRLGNVDPLLRWAGGA
jgi:DNA modification methylase